MLYEEVTDDSHKKRRTRCLLIGVAVVLVAVTVLVIVLAVILRNDAKSSGSFKKMIMDRCQTYLQEHTNSSRFNDCERIWEAFEQAYVGKDPCDVPPEAYETLINTVTQKAVCSAMMFWSKTKNTVRAFAKGRKCYYTLEDTLLGFLFDDLTWCSKHDSKETFTTDCPGWNDCQNNTVHSFWLKASAECPNRRHSVKLCLSCHRDVLLPTWGAVLCQNVGLLKFAATACGNVSAMLNGSLESPFSTTSVFGSVEVKNFDSDKMDSIIVFLITKDTDTTTCDSASFQDLRNALNPKIAYNCKEVPYDRIQGCISNPEIPCSDCL